MGEVIRRPEVATVDRVENTQADDGLDLFPTSVQALFEKLPDSLKRKILPDEKEGNEKTPQDPEKRLEEILRTFNTKEREKLMLQYLDELFRVGKFNDSFEAMSGIDLESEINRLLETLWNNRDKRKNVQIFNQDYYDNFFQARAAIVKREQEKQQEIAILKKSIETTAKQKRLTERKETELLQLKDDLELITDELERFDRQHGNSNYDFILSRDVAKRIKKETQWTVAAAMTTVYLDPTEFATAMAEQFDRVFYRESAIVRDPAKGSFGRPVSEDTIERAQEIIQTVTNTIESWHTAHENETSLKTPQEAKKEEQQAKLINYLISLMESYRRDKASKRPEDEMIYTIRQMEVSLNILGK